jgi:class 3 adenylate cyclase
VASRTDRNRADRPSKAAVAASAARLPLRFTGARDVPLAPAGVWRLLADTDHMNRVLGLPAMEASAPHGAHAAFSRRVRARILGSLPVSWTERPFEWVHERRWSVRRLFESGPFAEVGTGLELAPAPGGTRLAVTFAIVPRGWSGRLLARRVGPRSVAAVLGYVDRWLLRRADPAADPAPVPGAAPAADRNAVEAGLARVASLGVAPALLPRLRSRLLQGTDEQVLRVRPFEVADAWGADRLEVLTLFLQATRAGLFELRWEIMCPECRVPSSEVGSLAALPERFHCDACGIDYATDFDEKVELRFSVHPAIRRAADSVHCVGSPHRAPSVVAQQVLEPGETRSVEIPVAEPLGLRAVGGAGGLRLEPAGRGAGAADPGAAGAGPSDSPAGLAGRPAVPAAVWRGWWATPGGLGGGAPLCFVPGPGALAVTNDSPEPLVVVLERDAWNAGAATAARVTALQEFRDLFSSEVLAPGQEVGVSRIALLFTDLRGSTDLYEGVGDAPAYGRVNRHFAFLRERIAARRGAVVKTIGDAVMGAFVSLEDAVGAALEIQRGLDAWCAERGIEPALVLRAGVHHGPAIVVNANGRLDYFGRTANVAARLGRESRGGDVALTAEAFESLDPGAVGAGPFEVERFRGVLRGIAGEQQLVRLRPA